MIESGTTIRNSVLMGADFYPEEAPQPKWGNPPPGIGHHCHIEGAIIDKNARIADGVVITSKGSRERGRRKLLHSRRDRRCAERRRDYSGKSDLESESLILDRCPRKARGGGLRYLKAYDQNWTRGVFDDFFGIAAEQ